MCIRVRGHRPHPVPQRLDVAWCHGHAVDLADHLERACTDRPIVLVDVRQGQRHGGHDQLAQPLTHHVLVAEHPFEEWMHRLEVDEGLVHIEDERGRLARRPLVLRTVLRRGRHARSLFRPGGHGGLVAERASMIGGHDVDSHGARPALHRLKTDRTNPVVGYDPARAGMSVQANLAFRSLKPRRSWSVRRSPCPPPRRRGMQSATPDATVTACRRAAACGTWKRPRLPQGVGVGVRGPDISSWPASARVSLSPSAPRSRWRRCRPTGRRAAASRRCSDPHVTCRSGS